MSRLSSGSGGGLVPNSRLSASADANQQLRQPQVSFNRRSLFNAATAPPPSDSAQAGITKSNGRTVKPYESSDSSSVVLAGHHRTGKRSTPAEAAVDSAGSAATSNSSRIKRGMPDGVGGFSVISHEAVTAPPPEMSVRQHPVRRHQPRTASSSPGLQLGGVTSAPTAAPLASETDRNGGTVLRTSSAVGCFRRYGGLASCAGGVHIHETAPTGSENPKSGRALSTAVSSAVSGACYSSDEASRSDTMPQSVCNESKSAVVVSSSVPPRLVARSLHASQPTVALPLPSSSPSAPAANSQRLVAASRAMCAWCFAVLANQFGGKKRSFFFKGHSPMPAEPPWEIRSLIEAKVMTPVFVTWMKKRRNDMHLPFSKASLELRGCLGCLDAVPIADMARYALKSALDDTRFSPIARKEMPLLECRVSLLGNFEASSHPHDWNIDRHGVILKFTEKGTNYSATFLPGVAKENGMTHEVAIRELVRKSGWQGDISSCLLSSIRLTRYESSKASLTYDEFDRCWS